MSDLPLPGRILITKKGINPINPKLKTIHRTFATFHEKNEKRVMNKTSGAVSIGKPICICATGETEISLPSKYLMGKFGLRLSNVAW